MASTINASTSPAGIVQTADGTANLNLQSNGTTIAALTSTGMAVTGTLSASGVITATGGVVVGAAAAPAFSAYLNANQSISNVTVTKVQCNTETFDTNSNYNNATYTFTPTVAGYYQVIASLRDQTGSSTGSIRASIYKNGTDYALSVTPMTTNSNTATCSVLIYMNGSTDYLEFYCYQNSGTSINIQGNSYWTYFNAFLARSA